MFDVNKKTNFVLWDTLTKNTLTFTNISLVCKS